MKESYFLGVIQSPKKWKGLESIMLIHTFWLLKQKALTGVAYVFYFVSSSGQ